MAPGEQADFAPRWRRIWMHDKSGLAIALVRMACCRPFVAHASARCVPCRCGVACAPGHTMRGTTAPRDEGISHAKEDNSGGQADNSRSLWPNTQATKTHTHTHNTKDMKHRSATHLEIRSVKLYARLSGRMHSSDAVTDLFPNPAPAERSQVTQAPPHAHTP